ncbi:MAG: hypothetical protein IPP17_24810 [Bacteroidetes bacterium]|nr:hypothetical protein [Bacteroidota bacterium]
MKPLRPEIRAIREYLYQTMAGLLTELKEFDIKPWSAHRERMRTISAMIAQRKKRFSSENLNSYRYSGKDFLELNKLLIHSTQLEREAIPGMDPLRAEMINMGSLLIEVLLEEIGCKEMMVSTYALKEGILYRHIEDQKERARPSWATQRGTCAPKPSATSAKNTITKTHVLKVSELAQSIYDQLKPLHPFGTLSANC